jgi:hypothetical protein
MRFNTENTETEKEGEEQKLGTQSASFEKRRCKRFENGQRHKTCLRLAGQKNERI